MFAFDAHSFGKSEPLEPAKMRSYVLSPHHLVDDVYSYVQVSCLSGILTTAFDRCTRTLCAIAALAVFL